MFSLRSKTIFRILIGEGDILPDLPKRFRNAPLRERYVVPIMFLISLISMLILTFMEFLSNIHIDLVRACSSLPCTLSFITYIPIYCHFLINRKRFYSLFDEMEALIDERIKSKVNEAVYMETERKLKFGLDIFSYALVVPFATTFTPFLLVAYHCCLGKYSIDSWFFFSPIWTPFEVNTTTRCASVVLSQSIIVFCAATILYSTISILVELTVHTSCFLYDVKRTFTQMNRLTNAKDREELFLGAFKDSVNFHESINRCMSQFTDVSNFIVLAIGIPFAGSVCNSLFVLDRSLGNTSLHDLQMPVYGAVIGLQILFIIFYIGEKLHSNLSELSDVIYQSEWYRYPRNVRRFVLLMMMRAQQPCYLSAYGVMALHLENFVVVLKWIYSALMLLRSLD